MVLGVLFYLTHLLGNGYGKFMLLSFSVETRETEICFLHMKTSDFHKKYGDPQSWERGEKSNQNNENCQHWIKLLITKYFYHADWALWILKPFPCSGAATPDPQKWRGRRHQRRKQEINSTVTGRWWNLKPSL